MGPVVEQRKGPPTTAIILAAGLGSRLRDVHPHSPKGLLLLDGVPIIQRSLDLLRQQGVTRIVLVTGHMRQAYEALAVHSPGVELAHNPDYATTGSMASLACALPRVREDFLLLECDLVYDAVALPTLLHHPSDNVLLMSGPTSAGDEVWVQGRHGKLVALDKDATRLDRVDGEFVGINRISSAMAGSMMSLWRDFVARRGHGRMSYETDAMVAAAARMDVHLALLADLIWGEIDDASHLKRIVEVVWPALRVRLSPAADGLPVSSGPVRGAGGQLT